MIHRYFKVKTVKQRTPDHQEVFCDNCNRKTREDGLFEVKTYHTFWGNDSVDSIETHHFCCKSCMDVFLDEYWLGENAEYADIVFRRSAQKAEFSLNDEVKDVEMEEDADA